MFRWVMKTKEEYVPFWSYDKSCDLDSIASIYGCQEFERDIMGLIWGRDFVIRKGKWTVGSQNAIYDTLGGFKKDLERSVSKNIHFLANRYRIFLTRGIIGTYIYCEDPETQRYLESFLK